MTKQRKHWGQLPNKKACHKQGLHFVDSSSLTQDAEHLAMDRRRLESAHLKYTMFNVCSWYPSLSVEDTVFRAADVNDTVLEFLKKYYLLFFSKYGGYYFSCLLLVCWSHAVILLQNDVGHSCKYPGCKKVLVLDGNMKNRRDVCMARNAGYTDISTMKPLPLLAHHMVVLWKELKKKRTTRNANYYPLLSLQML